MRKLLFAVIGLAALGGSAQSIAAEAETLRYGVAPGRGGLTMLPVRVAQAEGFYEAEGITLEFVVRSGDSPMGTVNVLFDAMNAGEIDLMRTQVGFMAVRVLNGEDMVAIAGATINPVYTLIAKPEIRSFDDLKGQFIGLTLPDDAITLTMRELLEENGIAPGDVRIGFIQGSEPRYECLTMGECAAVPVSQPTDFAAVEQGYNRLGISNDIGPILFNVDVIMRGWGVAHEDLVVRYVRASANAMRFINDPANAARVRPLVIELAEVSEEVADEILAFFHDPEKKVLPRQAELDMEAFQNTLDLMDKYEKLPLPHPAAEAFVDLRYLQAAGIE